LLGAVERGLGDPDPLVRAAAAEALEHVEPESRLRLGVAVLADPVRTVRLAAARVLVTLPRSQLDGPQREALEQGLREYRDVQRFHAERPESHLNLGWLYTSVGRRVEAEDAYQTALSIVPAFAPAAINLADLYRELGRESEGESVLRSTLARSPQDAGLHHALGLLLARTERGEAALESLRRACDLEPGVPRYAYVLGVGLHSAGRTDEALDVLERAHRRFPGEGELLFALATIERDAGDVAAATAYAKLLVDLAPEQPIARELLDSLAGPRLPGR
jgi:tetratricopeptide (TPR) repeat protein